MALLYLAYLSVVAGWQWRRCRQGVVSRWRALGHYLGYGLLPPSAYALLFFAAVAIEELTGAALVAESFARALPLVLASGVVATLVMGLVLGALLLLTGSSSRR